MPFSCRRLLFAAAGAVAISLFGNTTAAFAGPSPVGTASDGSPIWASEADVQPPVGTPGTGVSTGPRSGGVKPLAVICDAGYTYTVTNSIKNTYDVKFNTSVENNSRKDVKYTVKADESGTTTFGLSISVEEELKAGIFASIKGSVNGSVQKSMTTAYGSSVEVSVEPASTLHVQYGIWRENVAWKSYYMRANCSTTKNQSGTAWAPYEKRWKIFY